MQIHVCIYVTKSFRHTHKYYIYAPIRVCADHPSHLINSLVTGTRSPPSHAPSAEVGIFRSLGGFQTLQEKKFGKGALGVRLAQPAGSFHEKAVLI